MILDIQQNSNSIYVVHGSKAWERLAGSVQSVILSLFKQQTLDDETPSRMLDKKGKNTNHHPLVPMSYRDIAHSAPASNDPLALRSSSRSVKPVNLWSYPKGLKKAEYLIKVFRRKRFLEYVPILQAR